MPRTPFDTRTARERLLDDLNVPATADDPTDAQKGAYRDGKARHAEGDGRPDPILAAAIYGPEATWFLRGWDDAKTAADTAKTPRSPWRRCSACTGVCHWNDDAWTCDACGSEWYADHDPKYAAPGD